jgi:cytochrome c5
MKTTLSGVGRNIGSAIAVALLLSGCGEESSRPQVPSFSAPELQQGRAVWMQVCRNCHLMGVAGAPAISDYPAWQTRLAADRKDLYQSAIRGIGEEGSWSMPPRGGNDALSDADVRRAVDFMLAAVEALRSDE